MKLKSLQASRFVQSIVIGAAVLLGAGVFPQTLRAEEVETNIVATTVTDFGFVRQLKIGADTYWVNAYTDVSKAWEFTVPEDVTAIDYLVVGGGGAGMRLSTNVGGGGGAGGLLQGAGFAVSAGDTLTLTVGKGGVQTVNGEGRTQANSPGEDKYKGITSTASNGRDSVVKTNGVELLRAYGGAGGGAKGATKRGGGSGGGTGAGTTAYVAMPGTDGQGHDGGARESAFSSYTGATGGGGAGSPGDPLSVVGSKDGTDGGEGLPSSITGELLWYAAGGGGAAASGGTHGKGGGGIGDVGGDAGEVGAPGKDGTGTGGGGSSKDNTTSSGKGGSGIIVIRYKAVAGKTSFNAATVEFENSSFVYDGAAKPVVLKSITLVDGTVLTADQLTEGEDYEMEPTEVGPDAGKTAVTVSGLGDYDGSSSAGVEITPATPVITGSFEQPDWEWGLDPVKPTGDVTSTFGTVVFRYYRDEDCTQPVAPQKYLDPGTYYVRAEVEATANWVAAAGGKRGFEVHDTYRPVPKKPVATDFGYTVRMKINGQYYETAVFTNTDAAATFTVPKGVCSLEYLVVAGGGSGGNYAYGVESSGGGGAGGFLEGALAVCGGDVLTVAVGKGGVKGTIGGGGEDGNGFDSVVATNGFETVRAIGGGTGGVGKGIGRSGGSGGGSGVQGRFTKEPYAQPGTEGQGHAGGRRDETCFNCSGGTGGGGAGSAGVPLTDPASKDATAGGEGLQSSITGLALWYAAGGGGSSGSGQPALGGNGIGGNGGAQGTDGVDGTGSGGGGSSKNGNNGGNGGSGIVAFRYPYSSGLMILLK